MFEPGKVLKLPPEDWGGGEWDECEGFWCDMPRWIAAGRRASREHQARSQLDREREFEARRCRRGQRRLRLSSGEVELELSHAALQDIQRLSIERCYKAEQVLRVELAGYEVLGGLLDLLVPAVLADVDARSKRQRKLLELLRLHVGAEDSPYQRILRVTDFLAALTDRSAVRLFRELRGTELAGARGV